MKIHPSDTTYCSLLPTSLAIAPVRDVFQKLPKRQLWRYYVCITRSKCSQDRILENYCTQSPSMTGLYRMTSGAVFFLASMGE